ncbi:hypothetical protein LQ318_00205 [Aliifodinibius salicampi]|uniref:DUF2059 domain-containing protein n=1 Tax=Fodinibius salicampi TaxID=1920655 RepID=A0ABT3PTY2_9BACT|nr:hypothetical protein [Fodinibius salicampi]MCW9711311.1 hypothetical protein [Fodinibius salicampi]
MPHQKFFLLTLCLFLLPFITSAQKSNLDSETEVINYIFEELPLEEKINEHPRELHEQFSQNPFGLSPSKNDQMMDLFLQAFTADSLVYHTQEVFRENFDENKAQSVTKRLKDESIQEVLEAEQEFYSLQGIRKRVVNRYELEQNPPSDARTKLINSLVASMSAAETETESQLILFRAIVTAFGKLSDERTLSDSQIDNFVNNFRNRMQGQVDQELTQQYLLKYHGLDNEVLQQYQSFYESEAGNWLNKNVSQGIQSAYQKASDRFLESVQNL